MAPNINILFLKKVRGAQTASSHSTIFLPYIGLTLDETVTITESFYKTLCYSELFSALGGSLGLWLGVGLMQIIERATDFGNTVYAFLKHPINKI